MYNLTTRDGVLAYLKTSQYSASDVQLLTGGRSAFTFRARLETPLPSGETTIILKHFEAYGAAFTQKKIFVERGYYEYKALVALANSGLFDSNSAVQVPTPIHYDPETYTIFMLDLGPLTSLSDVLASRIQASPSITKGEYGLAADVGSALGNFFGNFHNWSASPEQAQLRKDFVRNRAPETATAFHHTCMVQSVPRLGPKADEPLVREVLGRVQTSDILNGDVLAMGDTFLNNVMVSPTFDIHHMRLYVLDWETARPAPPELDVGVATGMVHSFGAQYKDYPLLPAFQQAYRKHRTVTPVKIATITGMYACGMSTMMPWTKDQGEDYARGIVSAGFELLKLAYDDNKEGIREHAMLKHLFA